MNLNFLKGHMGGNRILLLPGVEKDDSWLVETALELLEQKYLCCHQAGFLYPTGDRNRVKVRIVGFSTRGFISSCGGLTQVLGVAARGGYLEHLGLCFPQGESAMRLETEAGEVLIHLLEEKENDAGVLTDMSSFVDECRSLGIQDVTLEGINALRVGKFLVVNADELRRRGARGKFETFDADAFATLKNLQTVFQNKYMRSFDYALYDWSEEKKGHIRAVFPHGIERGHVEPACGTGSVAVGLAAVFSGELEENVNVPGNRIELILETGGGIGLAGDETTRLVLETDGCEISKVFFSHSKVEILATGIIRV